MGMPIATFPLGTENLLARHFGISRSGSELRDTVREASKQKPPERFEEAVQRYYRDNRFLLYGGGTHEILRTNIARWAGL